MFVQILAFSTLLLIFCSATKEADDQKQRLASSSRDYVPLVVPVEDTDLQRELAYKERCHADAVKLYFRTSECKRKPNGGEPISPFTLLPSKFPRKLYDQAEALQPAMNLLYFRASLDHQFIHEVLDEMIKDEKMKAIQIMVEIMDKVREEGGYERQPINLNFQRADYMPVTPRVGTAANAEDDEYELKQIEVNNGIPGGATLGRRTTLVHRKALENLGLDASPEVLRENNPDVLKAEAYHLAWLLIGDPNAVMLNVMGDYFEEHNKTDQWMMEPANELLRISGGQLKTVDIGLQQCAERLRLDLSNYNLYLDDGRRVAIVYSRGGGKISSDEGRHAVYTIERSNAIKAPNLPFELLGLKKAQQALAMPGVVERYFPDPAEAHYITAIRKVFAGLWGLENKDDETEAVIEDAIEHPERYVLKPMLEGGGNNFFGQLIADKLREFTPADRAAHILMERLVPMTFNNYRVPPQEDKDPVYGEMIGELSIYGCLVGNGKDGGTVMYNHAGGYEMRTKWSDSDEGGVKKGGGSHDSPYLY